DPVERMKVIEVHHVVLNVLRPRDDVANDLRVGGNLDAQSVLDGAHRSERMHGGAYAADTLCPDPRLARIAAAEDQLDPAEHGAGAPRVGDAASVHLGLNAEVALNASDRINNDAGHYFTSVDAVVVAWDSASGGALGADLWKWSRTT